MRDSHGFSDRFSTAGGDFAEGLLGFGAAGFPTVKYLRIFSSRFGPSPRIASKSSTILNGPYHLRIRRILSVVEANPRHQLQFFRRRRIDVYRLRRRLFLGERTSAEQQANNKGNAN